MSLYLIADVDLIADVGRDWWYTENQHANCSNGFRIYEYVTLRLQISTGSRRNLEIDESDGISTPEKRYKGVKPDRRKAEQR